MMLTAMLKLTSTFCIGSKSVQIRITDDGEFGQNKNFQLELGEPRLLDLSQRKGVGVVLTSCSLAPPPPPPTLLFVSLLWFS